MKSKQSFAKENILMSKFDQIIPEKGTNKINEIIQFDPVTLAREAELRMQEYLL